MGSGLIAREPRTHRSWLALCTGLVLAVCFALSAAPAMAATDWDGDGSTDSDCAPLDPAVHPGAADKPDLAFEDTNCDGIDGDKANAMFVTLGGDDGAPGTLTNPKHTINAAITAAAASDPKKDVYVAGGNYSESVNLADGVGVYGGYEPITGLRNAVQVTSITGSPAAQATGENVVLQLLTLNGQADASRNAYGLRALPNGATPSRLVLEKVTAKGLAAAAGADGAAGPNGAAGLAGNNGGGGPCLSGPARLGPGGFGGAGGSGGNNAGGATGATGGTVGSAFGGTGGGLLGTVL